MELETRDDAFPVPDDAADVSGLIIRHLRRPDDDPALNDIANAGREAAGG